MNELHSLLQRQLRRHKPGIVPHLDGESDFLRAVNDAYLQFDVDRRMLEHSLELTSQELLERNAELSSINAELEMRVAARTLELSSSEARFRGLFEHAPVSIWEEDFSAVRQHIDNLRRAGVVDFPAYFDAHPEDVAESAVRVKIVDVNRTTLEMYQADSKSQLLADLSKVLGPESLIPFKEELLALVHGETSFENETINYTLRGERRIVFIRLTVAPGYEQTWDKVFVGISDVTERRQAETALAVERDLLQALMDNIPDTIYFKDAASRFTRINPAQGKVLGLASPEEAIGKTDLDFQAPELAKGFFEEEQRIIETGVPMINRVEFNPTHDGRPRWFSATKVPIRDIDGSVTGIVGVSRDITELRQAEAALAIERDLLQALMDNIPDLIYFKDSASRFTRINRAEAGLLGVVSPEEAIGKTDLDFQKPDLAQSFYEEEQRLVQTGEAVINRLEFNPTPSGEPRWFSTTKVPIKDADNDVIGIVGTSRDITELRLAEAALEQSEILFRALFNLSPDAVIVIDPHDPNISWPIIDCNVAACLMNRYEREELIGRSIDILNLTPGTEDERINYLKQLREVPYLQLETNHRRKNGEIIPVEISTTLIKVGTRELVIGIDRDITDRKQAEEALRQSEERFRLMAWATRDAVWDWDLRTKQIWWGAGLQKIFRYPSETLQTDPEWRSDHIHKNDRAKVDRTIQQALEGGMEFWSKEYRFQRLDGTYADIMDRAYILRNNAGQPYRMLGAMMDITERKQIEEIIRNQNEMLSSLYEITLDLLKYHDIDALLNAMVELSAKFLGATFAEIMLMEGEELVVKAAAKNQSYLVGRRMSRGDAVLSWQAVDARKHVVLEDYSSWSLRGASYNDQILHAVVTYPIMNDDECLGVLGLGRDKPGYEFTTDQIQFGSLLANLTALILNNAQLREALREQSIHDPLTGLFNRRYMEEVLKQHLSRVTRQHHPLGMIMVDIDHFKRFNDAHGHAAGDALLREVGRLLQNQIRVEDIACRYGGEEFLLIMPGASIAETWARAGQLRQEVKELQIEHEGRIIGEITLSAGVAVYPEHGSTKDSLMRAADAALYRAKQDGRDQVILAETRN